MIRTEYTWLDPFVWDITGAMTGTDLEELRGF